MVDGRDQDLSGFDQRVILRLCHRRFGVGADGLIVLSPSQIFDYRMTYYNADGLEGTMCGNGGRCIAAFAYSLGITGLESVFEGIDGKHRADILPDGGIRLKLNDVEGIRRTGDGYLVNTGSPHFVKFVENLEQMDISEEGKAVRYQSRFGKEGVNVNFVEPGLQTREISVRTYERGVEAETYSCGTGAAAAAISAYYHYRSDNLSYNVRTLGGILNVTFESHHHQLFSDVYLTGPVSHVYDGVVAIRA